MVFILKTVTTWPLIELTPLDEYLPVNEIAAPNTILSPTTFASDTTEVENKIANAEIKLKIILFIFILFPLLINLNLIK